MLRVVLPKGSLERPTFELFEAADLAISRASDVDYKATIADPRVSEVRILRPQEIPRYVADGLFDIGITGRDWIEETLDKARGAGFRALCVTVDRAWYGRRERDLISRANVREGFGDPRYQAGIVWSDLVWMKERMGGPLVVKGIATGEDAHLAVDHGADVIYVSNHGGRQLDHGQGSIDVLPEVVEAVAGRAEVLVDGGILRGTDVVKAIALGARAVGVGKLLGWSLAAGGQAGIERMLELMEIEIRTTMGLMGVTSLAQLDPSWVRRVVSCAPLTTTSAYPWYEEHLR